MRKSLFIPAVLVLGAVFFAGYALRPAFNAPYANGGTPPQIQKVATGAAPSMKLPDFASLVEREGPAVVNITVTARRRAAVGQQDFPDIDPESPLAPFFRHFGVPRQPEEFVQQGEGSGFIVRKDGIILTNTHVVAGATEVTVKLTDRREFPAKVLGSDRRTDVAVLKIDAKDLPVVNLGDSDSVRVGQWVVAIGSPFGFENSVTSGIVSAKARSVPGEDSDSAVPFIQTDVAVNPGNSGGPLFDLNGNVVGINSQIYSRSGGYQGISFAIPIETALNVQQQILQTGKVRHGKLGVGVQPVSQQLADSFGLKSIDGALIGQIERGSAGERAGLRAGDVILAVDQQRVSDPSQLVAKIASMLPGTKVELTIWRDKREQTLEAKLGGEETGTAVAQADKGKQDRSGKLGLTVRPLTPQEQRESGLDEGLVVENSAGAAAMAGIQEGDVVLAVNQTPVSTVQELRSAVNAAGKGTLALLIQRGDARTYVPIRLGE